MSSRIFTFLAIVTLGLTGMAGAAERQLPGRVLRVVDGDSLILDVRGSQYRVELADIDAPELNQPWGQEAAQWLQRRLTGSFVVVNWVDSTVDGRVRGSLTFKNGDPGTDLLHSGLAWCTIGPVTRTPYEQNHPYRDAEAAARLARRGLWSDDHAIPPWEWRRQGLQPSD